MHKFFFDTRSDLHALLHRCKALAKAIKTHDGQRAQHPDSAAFMLPKDIADRLVGLYLETFESVYRVLHIPTFQREYHDYWNNPASCSDGFRLKFLLVMAVGSCFYEGPDEIKQSLRAAAAHAVRNADSWHCAPFSKHHLSLATIQIYCLVLIARQTAALDLGHDLQWVSAGSLLHTAFAMGLNRDPSCYARVTVFQAEMRRRLWATIMELVVQSSLDSGLPPLVSLDDYDCGPPSNINDQDISEDTASLPAYATSESRFTQTTLSRMLYKTIPLRLRVAKSLNGIGLSSSYEDVLQLSRELGSVCRSNPTLLQSMVVGEQAGDADGPKDFGIHLVDLLTRRFLYSLHIPFARRSATSLEFYYSRRLRLETALKMLLHLPTESCRTNFSKLWIVGHGPFKSTMSDATATVCRELLEQLREDPPVAGSPMTLSQKELYQAVQAAVETTRRRVTEGGETNGKGYIFFSCGLAQIDALAAGGLVDGTLEDVAREKLLEWQAILKTFAESRGLVVGDGDVNTDRQGFLPAGTEAGDATVGVGVGADGLSAGVGEMNVGFSDGEAWAEFRLQNHGLDFDTSPDSWIFSENWNM